jgi:hypothetical protein
MSTEETTTTSTETAATPIQKLTADQEIQALRVAHQFFSTFDRVPGFLANQWSQALDAVAVVANSLIAKSVPETTETTETTETSSTSSEEAVGESLAN